MDGATAVAVTAEGALAVAALPAPDRSPGWWQAWRVRFGLAEVCGTLAAVAGFAAGYLPAGSLLAAAALATICEAIGFYGCIGAKTVWRFAADSGTELHKIAQHAPGAAVLPRLAPPSDGGAGGTTTCYSGRSAFNGYPAPVIRIMR